MNPKPYMIKIKVVQQSRSGPWMEYKQNIIKTPRTSLQNSIPISLTGENKLEQILLNATILNALTIPRLLKSSPKVQPLNLLMRLELP